MSRASVSSARPLSLTEELEKLEQSITLTLQEIDHNFSRAHRIVTTSILPIVEQYADHSKAVWEGSKVGGYSQNAGRDTDSGKQFFEASANVSLSGVEEREEEEDASYSQSHDHTNEYTASHVGEETLQTEDHTQHTYEQDDSMLDDNEISGSTPRAPHPRSIKDKGPQYADFSSPYEDLKKEIKGINLDDEEEDEEEDDMQLPSTPGAKQRIPDMSTSLDSSPFDPTSYQLPSAQKPKDPLLHRVLDKNYRIQATPLTTRKDKDRKTPLHKPSWRDAQSPLSSPPVAAPQLHADIFSSPVRQPYRPNAPRTPGVSVQTPAKGKGRDIFARSAKKEREKEKDRDEITWESDSDEDAEDIYKELGMSPPKTIQFSLPQSRLLQTPAREASKRIVEDLLTTAGAGFDDTDGMGDSPSVVAMRDDFDDSF
ncbi:dash complex subunit ask1 protein [Rutstroemia sp. NJR-2017a BBW]|nr:dash complex subunit ask1 protein [Rutstroemia sp. NJR-2017a BBW]